MGEPGVWLNALVVNLSGYTRARVEERIILVVTVRFLVGAAGGVAAEHARVVDAPGHDRLHPGERDAMHAATSDLDDLAGEEGVVDGTWDVHDGLAVDDLVAEAELARAALAEDVDLEGLEWRPVDLGAEFGLSEVFKELLRYWWRLGSGLLLGLGALDLNSLLLVANLGNGSLAHFTINCLLLGSTRFDALFGRFLDGRWPG